MRQEYRLKYHLVLFRAVIPASLAGIAAIGLNLQIGILALCADWFIMLHTRGLGFLIHENWLLFYYLDIPWVKVIKKGPALFLNHTFIIIQA